MGTRVSGVGSLGLETSCALSLGHHSLFCSFRVALLHSQKGNNGSYTGGKIELCRGPFGVVYGINYKI